MTKPFDCRRCHVHFVPRDDQWIFHTLCDECFVEFNDQKMRGRFSGHRALYTTAPPEVLATIGMGSADEIPDQPQPYFESCDAWLASLAPKEIS